MKNDVSNGFYNSLSTGIINKITYGGLQALVAFSIYYSSCFILQTRWRLPYGLLVAIGTILVYLAHKLLKSKQKFRLKFQSEWIYMISLGLIISFVAIKYPLPGSYYIHLILPTILTAIYLFALERLVPYRLRIGWLKPVILAFTWTWICVGPVSLLDINFLYYSMSCGLMLLCNAILFDIKDIKQDENNHRATMAVMYGWQKTKKLAISSLIVSTVCALLLFREELISSLLLLVIFLIYSLICRKINLQIRPDFYYKYLDGGLILFPLGMFLARYFQNSG